MNAPLFDRPAYRAGYVSGSHWGVLVGFVLGTCTTACAALLWQLVSAALATPLP